MRYTNYDIIETESGDLFLYLSSQYYKLTGDPKMESFARKNIHKDFGRHKKTGDLREWVAEAMPKSGPSLDDLLRMKETLDAADVPADDRWASAVDGMVDVGFKPSKVLIKSRDKPSEWIITGLEDGS